jgi:hypothetical protein
LFLYASLSLTYVSTASLYLAPVNNDETASVKRQEAPLPEL